MIDRATTVYRYNQKIGKTFAEAVIHKISVEIPEVTCKLCNGAVKNKRCDKNPEV